MRMRGRGECAKCMVSVRQAGEYATGRVSVRGVGWEYGRRELSMQVFH